MNAVAIGPLVFDGERFAVIIGVVVFLAVSAILARRIDDRLGWWSSLTALAGVAAARLGHVLQHLDSFGADPWRALAIWQGGFSWTGGAAGVAIMLIVLVLKNRKLAGWAAASIAAGAVTTASALWFAGTGAGIPAPSAAFRSLTGTERMIGRSGRPVVLNLWASWCPPCRRELPMMAEVAKNAAGVEFVFANQGEAASVLSGYLRDGELRLPDVVLDPDLSLSRHYAAPGLPATLFLTTDGSLAASHLGEISREVLEQKIQEITKKDRKPE